MIVIWLVPAAIVPISVPSKFPLPILRVMLTPVGLATLAEIPLTVCDWTTTEIGTPATGFAPLLTDKTTSFAGDDPKVTPNFEALLAES
jgi:hypothetical protein